MRARYRVPLTVALLVVCATVSATVGCRAKPAEKPRPNEEDAKTDLSEKELIDRFHLLYYSRKPYINTYLGVLSAQYPNDNWIMQEIIVELKPDFLIETGTLNGGTSLFYADILEKVHPMGKVITVDILERTQQVSKFRNWHQRVRFILGSSVDPGVVKTIARTVRGAKTVMVTLDSDHNKEHVLKELRDYAPMVTRNSYIVVQDTHLNGHPVHHVSAPGEGPAEAVAEFLKTTGDFVVDASRERHLITQSPGGYLKRVR